MRNTTLHRPAHGALLALVPVLLMLGVATPALAAAGGHGHAAGATGDPSASQPTSHADEDTGGANPSQGGSDDPGTDDGYHPPVICEPAADGTLDCTQDGETIPCDNAPGSNPACTGTTPDGTEGSDGTGTPSEPVAATEGPGQSQVTDPLAGATTTTATLSGTSSASVDAQHAAPAANSDAASSTQDADTGVLPNTGLGWASMLALVAGAGLVLVGGLTARRRA